MTTKEWYELVGDDCPPSKRWQQTDDGWFNIWKCLRGNSIAYRIEKDGAPMRETTAIKLVSERCANCYNKEGCKFYDLYR